MAIFRLSMIALACVSLVSVKPTGAVQTTSSRNPANVITAGTTRSQLSVPGSIFATGGLRPGDTSTRCVALSNTGDVTYSETELSGASSGGLADDLEMTIDVGTGTSGSSCTGFSVEEEDAFKGPLSGLPTLSAPLVDATDVEPGASVSYRITVELPADAAQSAQNQSVSFAMRWESRTP